MRVPISTQHQKNADLLGWQAEERFEVRRAAGRKRASASATSRAQGLRVADRPEFADARFRPSVPHHHLPSTPWLLATVVGSLGALFALAVVGAYALIRAVLGSD